MSGQIHNFGITKLDRQANQANVRFTLDIHFHQIKMLIKDYVDFVLAMSVL